ncbi:MAG TPA: ferrochelatase [Thermoplasmata archaeon]|nr:ferrochelatase [Thermoplasmata archaeon]
MTAETAVLFMAYGTPRTLDEVGPYFRDIRGGRAPSEAELRNLRARYEAVGGRTPLVDVTERQAKGTERLLRERGRAVRAYVGMKHWHPFIREAIAEIFAAGHRHIVAIPLAPFYSAVSTEGYRKAIEAAVAGEDVTVRFVGEWYDDLKFFDAWHAILRESFDERPLGGDGHLVFTAHSLPVARMPPGDPYERQLRALAAKLADAVDAPTWTFAFQSAGMVGGQWLGPAASDVMDALAANGVRDVLVTPLGFVADNLETLYDLDRELAAHAKAKGLAFRRAPVPNDRSEFLAALADIVARNL